MLLPLKRHIRPPFSLDEQFVFHTHRALFSYNSPDAQPGENTEGQTRHQWTHITAWNHTNIQPALYFSQTHTHTRRPSAALTRLSMVGKIEIERGKQDITVWLPHRTDRLIQTELLSARLKLRESDRPVNVRERERHRTNTLGWQNKR